MPTLTFTEGDIAEIYAKHNELDEATSLHWHGTLPNKEDGVPF
jgi:FtsP/CotA-like multicopper oxidase with cupredoxin domain